MTSGESTGRNGTPNGYEKKNCVPQRTRLPVEQGHHLVSWSERESVGHWKSGRERSASLEDCEESGGEGENGCDTAKGCEKSVAEGENGCGTAEEMGKFCHCHCYWELAGGDVGCGCFAGATAPHVMEVEQGVPFHPVAADRVDQTLSLCAAGRLSAW